MVCAIVVTHNRPELLRQCLTALRAQTQVPERVIVVDNASTDGTAQMLERDFAEVDVLSLTTNEGSAGGFHEGMRQAHAAGAQWLWLMDDDTLAAPEALAELLAARDRVPESRPPSMLLSKVEWTDGRMHPMNVPSPTRMRSERMIEGARRGLIPVSSGTWISLLVHRGVVDRHGLPLKRFFIWSDDIEYTGRVLSHEPGFMVPESIVVHDTPEPHTAMTATPERFYYHVRNTLYIIRGPGRAVRARLVYCWVLATSTAEYLAGNPSLAAVRGVLRGLRDGLRPLPPP